MSNFKKTESINKELFSIQPSVEIMLFEIYDIANTSDIIRFHGGVNNIRESLIFDSLEYFYIPNEIEGLEDRADSRMTRPQLNLINIEGFFSRYIKNKDDLLGAKVKIIRTFLRFIDSVNFLNYNNDKNFWKKMGVNPDSSAKMRDQEWIINQKTAENKNLISYELTSPLDLENVKIPRRQIINNYCSWKYRGKGCGYKGIPVADSNNVTFDDPLTDRGEWEEGISYSQNDFVFLNIKEGSSTRKVFYVCTEANMSDSENKPSVNASVWVSDSCSKSFKGCKLRYTGEEDDHLPFGGFPGSRLF